VSTKEILLLGLPSSGKTTFLAALWHLLVQEEVAKTMKLAKWPDTREYLNKLTQKWVRFQPVDRNLLTEDIKKIQLALQNGDEIVDFHIPDMSGETWEALWENRLCPADITDLVIESFGIILFLHADHIQPPVDIMTIDRQTVSVQPASDSSPSPWNPKESPTQVKLVDLLQILIRPPFAHRNRRLVVVISAWDKVLEMNQTPEQFLMSGLPMLFQFLHFSYQYPSFKVYGVSALGGDLTLPTDLERLKGEDKPAKRVLVNDGKNVGHDLTIPIHWLLNGD